MMSPFPRAALAVALAVAASTCRADLFTTTIDPLGTPSGLQRFNDTTGVRLTGGEVAPGDVGGFAPFAPTDIVLGPDGNVYVSDAGTSSIFRFDAMTGAPAPPPNMAFPPGQFVQRPSLPPVENALAFTSLTFDSTGLLYVLDAYDVSDVPDPMPPQPGVRIYDSTGVRIDSLLESETTTLGSLSSLQFDSFGDLLISDRDNATIYRVDVETDTLTVFASTGVVGPAGIAVAGNGDVYVADLFGNQIVRYDPDGSNSQTFVALPPVPEVPFSNFPSDLVFDSEGNLIVAVLGSENPGPDGTALGMLLKYDPTGTLIDTIASELRPTSSVAIVPDLLPGDYNGDGLVDTADFMVWQESYGDEVPATSGADGNGDGIVDAIDYAVWRETLGASGFAPTEATAAAPEPSALVLAFVAVAMALRRRSRGLG